MATTQKFYRLRQRNLRYSTQLQSISKGMYLTDQLMPEGFCRVLVNYDIDDTGSNIKTRKGREYKSSHNFPSTEYPVTRTCGKMHVTDYIYAYNKTKDAVIDIKDVLTSFGKYGNLKDYFENITIDIPEFAQNPMYISTLGIRKDGSNNTFKHAWAMYCNKGQTSFHVMGTDNIGYVTARTIKKPYAFDKQVVKDLGYPVSTVMSNEIYTFSGNNIHANISTTDPTTNAFDSLSKPALTKFIMYQKNPSAQGYGEYYFERKVMTPKEINPTEAQSSGFNMLHDSPFILTDEAGGSPRILGAIVYATSTDDIPILSPDLGNTYAMRIYYQYNVDGETYQYKLEVTDATLYDKEYTTLTDWTNFTTGTEHPLWVNITPPYNKTEYRISIRRNGQTNTESQLAKLIDCITYKTITPAEFDLTTAKGMVSWLGCIGVYGVKDAPDTIFFSDVEDPSYFPFPNNVIKFDNEVLAVYNYLDMLLVITTDSIILVTIGATIAQSSQKKVMTNIFIPEIDAVNVVILKDQIFFKTDTQFYVLKPNKYTSDATDLKHYTNSIAIANYTIHFTQETLNILNRVYRPILNEESKLEKRIVRFENFDVINIESAVKNEEVHYVYTIVPYINRRQNTYPYLTKVNFGHLNLDLVYNTVTRSYRLYLIGVGNDDTEYTAKLYRNKQSGSFYEVIGHNNQVYVYGESLHGRDDNPTYPSGEWLAPYYNNYNYIDTGNVPIDDTYNKRYRELQMNIINREKSKIRFYTDVKIDGKVNVTSTRYLVQNVTDPDDPDYGLIYIVPEEVDDFRTMMTSYGNTTLEQDGFDLTKYWEIDLSKFPDLEMATIKLKLWGKGRRSAFQVLCTDLKEYELSTFVWVYRIMNVR